MPEPENGGTSGPALEPVRKPVHRHRQRPLIIKYWRLVPVGCALAFVPLGWHWLFSSRTIYDPLPGYITDTAKIEAEYLTFTGKPLDPAATVEFDHATELMRNADYTAAAIVLEGVAKNIPVPAVFNDLGLLYRRLKDGPHALRAFRDALARDHDYVPVRANLKKMGLAESADPGATELEPNNDNTQANAVWLDRPVQGTISPIGDVDCFWFITPKPPRDRVSLSVASQSPTLMARLRIYDHNGNMVTGVKEAIEPGGPVRYDFSPPPNTLYYVQIDGVSQSSGAYSLSVSALHAYDVYEPNDTILRATRVVPGHTIDANIMDGDDTDFYSFASPAAGTVTIDVTPHSGTLMLGLGTFAPDLRNIDFAPDPKAPGDSIHHQVQVEANQTYYVQVFSRKETAGPYSLVLK